MSLQKMQMLQKECNFDAEHFIETIIFLIHEPNVISPSLLRAEIVEWKGPTTVDEFVNDKNTTITIKRKLIPKQQKRDPVMWQVSTIEWKVEEREISVKHMSYDSTFTELALPECLPYFYPKVLYYELRYQYQLQTLYLNFEYFPNVHLDDKRNDYVWNKVLDHIVKICVGKMNGYQKKFLHDVAVNKISYQNKYLELKEKYCHWVNDWTEGTDPSKHVFEDISIATWLILLWNSDYQPIGREFRFVDVGCGNGFLTHILLSEGFKGYGIDLSRRKLWNLFPSDQQAFLVERPIDPFNEEFSKVEWIIGNHADELTPWVPIWASKYQCKFVSIPCCPHLLSGAKFTKKFKDLGRYESYCQFLIQQTIELGLDVEREHLRIPSTKNVAIYLRNPPGSSASLKAMSMIRNVNVTIRETDREKTLKRAAKKAIKSDLAAIEQ